MIEIWSMQRPLQFIFFVVIFIFVCNVFSFIIGENLMDISTLTKRYDYNHDTHINNQNYEYHKSTHDYQLQNTMTEIEKQQVCPRFVI